MIDTSNRIEVISTVKGNVGIDVPDLRLKRDWPRKGAKVKIDRDVLLEAMYYPGVEYMFQHGMLYTEDMDFKKAAGLEPEDATEPTNVIVLDDKQKKRYLTVAPVADLKEILKKLSLEQRSELANYAIENQYADLERSEIIKKACGIDVVKSIALERENKADSPTA